jgi:formate dehydrogenase subunit gamma
VAPATPAQDTAAKVAPALPAGSTAKPGWNVPPKWSEVEQKAQYASVPGRETNVLIQDAGRDWRILRNGPITFYGGIVILVVPALILLFYVTRGQIKVQSQPTGRLIERFNSAERVAHWTMGISFVVLAITGLALLFGKYLLLPILGAGAFAGIASAAKLAHNFVGPLFMFSLVVFVALFIRDNAWRAYDMAWLAKLGGLLSGAHVPSGRFNAGEKVWFWVGVILFGLVICVSGAVLLFPNWNTTRDLMGEANLVHASVASVLIAMALGHIYLGTVGLAGAYQAMREGTVDESWAKEHHEIWYNEVKSGKRDTSISGVPHPAAGDD